MRRVVLLLLVVGCATVRVDKRTATLDVYSYSWDADAVKAYCETGNLLVAIRGMDMGGHYVKRYDPMGCLDMILVIERRGGSSYRYPPLMHTGRGNTTCLTVQPYVGQSYATDCSRSAQ